MTRIDPAIAMYVAGLFAGIAAGLVIGWAAWGP